MAISTVLWGGFVKQDWFALNLSLEGMAHRAAHILVPSRQRELRAFIVVEGGRGPTLFHVASATLCDSILSNKLGAMRIRMTSFAVCGSSLELNFVGTGGNLVAFITRDGAMSPDQCKFRFRMVEASNVDPGSGPVTAFAAQRSPICALLCHPRAEFALMGIGVAFSACAIAEMERQYLAGSSAEACFVAFRAGDSRMRAREYETRFLVFRNREGRAMEVLHRVAIFATILVGRGGELLVMGILMAIGARREPDFVDRGRAGRDVTFITTNSRMFPLERIM